MLCRVFAIAAAPMVASVLALMLLPGSAIAQGLTTKVMVDARHEQVVSELEEAGASVVARRGAYVVMAVPSGSASAVLTSSGVVVRDDFDEIRLSRQTLSATAAPSLAKPDSRRLKLIQFAAPPVDADLEALAATGARIVQYVPQNAYLVWAPSEETTGALRARAAQSAEIQYYADYLPDHALARSLDVRKSMAPPVEVTVQLFNHEHVKQDIDAILSLADTLLAGPQEAVRGRYVNMRVSVAGTGLEEITQLASVVRVEPYVRPRLFGERQDQIMAGNLDVARQDPSGPGYLGWLAGNNFSTEASDYPIVVVVDDGVDDGSATPETDEFYVTGDDSLASRILFAVVPPGSSASGPEGPGGHGHINASIVGGYNTSTGTAFEDTSGFNYGLGVSPYGRMANVRIFAPGFDVGTGDATMVDDYYQRGARISTNSWGADVSGSYNTDAQLYDSMTRDARGSVAGNQELLFIFANGNAGPSLGTVGSPATAKNVLSVGASETSNPDASNGDGCGKNASDGDDARDMASFSSRGPSDDGRIKPEIVAPGTFIQGNASQPDFNGSGVCGAASNDFSAPGDDALFPAGSIYTWSSGTSHSTPGIAGYTSLITEFLDRVYDVTSPSPALVKAYVVHSGRQITGSGANEDLPGNNQGFGIADMGAGFDTSAPRLLADQATVFGSSGESITLNGQIVDASEEIRIALVWTDAPGSAFADAYVNDLDLVVEIGATTYRGNNFTLGVSQPGGTADFRNNSEAVFLAPGPSGSASITINATTIAGDGVPGNADGTDQDFALVAYNFSTTISDGIVSFDSGAYGCTSTVGIVVSDSDLSSGAPFGVSVTTTGGDAETVTLTESSSGSGVFEGSINTATGSVVTGDGTLSVSDAETITATYLDADDGTGSPASKQATALTDCASPVISNVASANLTGLGATISFDSDEATAGEVNYGTSCGSLSQSTAGVGTLTSHEISLSGLTPSTQYFYSVEATDEAGNVSTDDNGGACYSFTTADQLDYFTENFSAADLDVANQSLTLTPNGSANTYAACRQSATGFPTDPSGGTVISLSDDAAVQVSLTGGEQVSLYGTSYSSFYVGSNGYLTFGASDTGYSASLSTHFSMRRLSGLFKDLDPSSSGQVSWEQLADRVVVTYENVPEYASTSSNSFQFELFFDGTLRITHLAIGASDGIVGASAGAGVPGDFVESNLSAYASCAATISFDGSIYQCDDTLGLSIADSDLSGGASFGVSVVTTGGDDETLTMSEVSMGSGVFGGSINSEAGAVVVGDGILNVSDGETATATYNDASDGTGSPAVLQDTALVDCAGPVVSDIEAKSGDGSSADISFLTNEPASVQIRFGASCGVLDQTASASGLATSHDVALSGLSPLTQYFYVIDATDAAGNVSTDDNGGACHSFATEDEANDYFTEQFFGGDLDVANQSMTLTPNGSANTYEACRESTTTFPSDPSGGAVLLLSDDDWAQVSLSGGEQVSLYGTSYSSFYVGSNGYLTFGSTDASYSESLSAHFSMPRLSGLFDDLIPPEAGQVSWEQLADRVVVTYENVPEWPGVGANSFQFELFFDGTLRITHLAIAASDGIVGVSAGAGVPAGFLESDVTAYADCSVVVEVCGDGVVTSSETCDDGGTTPGDGCDAVCQIETGWMCSGTPSMCGEICGDGILTGIETCDDGGSTPGDGCDAVCQVESGWNCSGTPSVCGEVCGDGIVSSSETCDDSGTTPGDGCDAVCQVESGWSCSGTPSVCGEVCGDGIVSSSETCDDSGTTPGDGCDAVCQVESGWSCSGEPSVCLATAVPSLSRWSIGLLVTALLGIACLAYRRRGVESV